jgi:predicted site-specific integrase-resolvase
MESRKGNIRKEWVHIAILREHEVMEILGISQSTLRRLRKEGVLPYSPLGGGKCYLAEDLIMMLKNNMVNPVADAQNN